MDKYLDKLFLLIAVCLGFCMGMLTTYYQHKESMTAYELIRTQSANDKIDQQIKRVKR